MLLPSIITLSDFLFMSDIIYKTSNKETRDSPRSILVILFFWFNFFSQSINKYTVQVPGKDKIIYFSSICLLQDEINHPESDRVFFVMKSSTSSSSSATKILHMWFDNLKYCNKQKNKRVKIHQMITLALTHLL